MTKPEDTAFPFSPSTNSHCGLTKREYFAIRALEGLLANSSLNVTKSDEVSLAVEYADLLIAELNKE